MQFRPAQLDGNDLAAILLLQQRSDASSKCCKQAFDGVYVSLLNNRGRVMLLEDEGCVLGFSVGDERSGTVMALYVDPSLCGLGYGHCLLNELLDCLWQTRDADLTLTLESDSQSIGFFSDEGWRLSGPIDGSLLHFSLSHVSYRSRRAIMAEQNLSAPPSYNIY